MDRHFEGRQRSRAYAFSVVKEFRRAVDALDAGRPIDASELMVLAEGLRGTSGAYHKTWLRSFGATSDNDKVRRSEERSTR
jgi:collagenase-like PrtC family protease